MQEFVAGAIFTVPHPFVIEDYTGYGADGSYTIKTWRPGIRTEWIRLDDTATFADGVGEQILTVISTHKPGRFPARVFFTRSWRDPRGKVFGRTRLIITTAGAFRTLLKGYRYSFEIAKAAA